MVASNKIKFFKTRLDEIKREQLKKIDAKFKDNELSDVQYLVSHGKGTMKSEEEIRKAIGSLYSRCPLVIEVSDLFNLNGEIAKAKEARIKREKAANIERNGINLKVKKALDLVYFGTDEQMKAALDDLER
jgi:hypothetical protein